jgi:NADPH:quinone reductase
MLAHRGRLTVMASPGQRRVAFDLLDFYHKEAQLFGVDTLKRGLVQSAALLEAIRPGFEDGSFVPPVIAETFGLAQGAEAYRAVAGGTAGRVVLMPELG